MSFDFLEVDLSSVFEPGQAYVAVSRARTVKGLRIRACREILPQIVEDFYSSCKSYRVNCRRCLMSQKKRDTTFFPKIDVNKCISVLSIATQTQQFVLKQPFLSKDLPEGATDKIHRHVRDDCIYIHIYVYLQLFISETLHTQPLHILQQLFDPSPQCQYPQCYQSTLPTCKAIEMTCISNAAVS